jgi:hypothetical protein
LAKKSAPQSEQSKAFIETAKALECDESEERFDAVLKSVAKHRPVGTPSKATSKARKGHGRTS